MPGYRPRRGRHRPHASYTLHTSTTFWHKLVMQIQRSISRIEWCHNLMWRNFVLHHKRHQYTVVILIFNSGTRLGRRLSLKRLQPTQGCRLPGVAPRIRRPGLQRPGAYRKGNGNVPIAAPPPTGAVATKRNPKRAKRRNVVGEHLRQRRHHLSPNRIEGLYPHLTGSMNQTRGRARDTL